MEIYCDNCGCLIEDEDNMISINGEYHYCSDECMEEDYFGAENDDIFYPDEDEDNW